MKLIVGLGNPGKEYERTRHNAGFLAIDAIAEKNVAGSRAALDKKSNAEITPWEGGKEKILLVKPHTFMNSSGETVRKLMDFYKLSPGDIIVIHDDKDFPVGTYKIQRDRGAAGHNGVASIIAHLGTKDFIRIRIGVGPKEPGIEKIIDYVLEPFTAEEMAELKRAIAAIVETALPSLL